MKCLSQMFKIASLFAVLCNNGQNNLHVRKERKGNMMSGSKVQESFFPSKTEKKISTLTLFGLCLPSASGEHQKRMKMKLHIHEFKAQTNTGH